MGEVAGAGLLAHVPTIMLPRAERLELNEGKEISLVPGLQRLRREVFEGLDYDTVVVLDSHWHTTVEFVVAAQPVRAGLFTSDELPPGMGRIPYDRRRDPALAQAMAAQADAHAGGIQAMPECLKYRREARFGPYLMMIAALGEGAVTAPGRAYSEYENSVGTGQIHLWFDRPAAGWAR